MKNRSPATKGKKGLSITISPSSQGSSSNVSLKEPQQNKNTIQKKTINHQRSKTPVIIMPKDELSPAKTTDSVPSPTKNEFLFERALSELLSEIENLLVQHKEWRLSKISKIELFKQEYEISDAELSSCTLGNKIIDIRKKFDELKEVIKIMQGDIESLSNISAWEQVQKKKAKEIKVDNELLGIIREAKSNLQLLKQASMESEVSIPNDNLMIKNLQLQLQQSKRDRRNLEIQLKCPEKLNEEMISQTVDQMLQDGPS
ncbi:unnamed protein product [Blepharisma stoltei]|uniref:Uncharacterized protein n=1 Tax=Blepharisma stoltei TaxID=1481888 RepID=A0AAU9II25_9CILI|nr:unnamed protein product [Blepharisma stoltei]